MKHTPGPWLVNEAQGNTEHKGRLYIDPQDQSYVGIVTLEYGPHDKIERIRKDAQLIASAPDLLAACKETLALLKYLGSTGHLKIDYSPLEKAISKAEGETK